MKLSGWLYRAARLSRDVNAVSRGPGAVGRRAVRKPVYRAVNRATAKVLRRVKL